MLKLDRLTLEPRFIDRNICFCTGDTDPSDTDNEPRGTTFGVNGRSVTGSTAQDKAIGWSDGSGNPGANYDALSDASSSDVRAAVSAANEAAKSGGDTVQAAAGIVGGAGLDVYGIGDEGEFSTGAAPASAALAALTEDSSFNQSPASQNLTRAQQAIVESALARGETPPDFSKPMTEAEKARDRNLIDIFSETDLDPAAGQEEAYAEQARRDAIGQQFLADIQKELGITRADTATAANVVGTPMDAGEFAGSGIRSLPDTVYDSDMGMVGSRTSAPSYGGYEDDAAYDADLFGTPRYAGGITGLDGKLQGFEDVTKMGDFAESATRGGILGKVTDYGMIPNVVSRLTGQTPMDMRRGAVQEFFEAGAQFNPESGKMELEAGPGTLKMSESGVVTYSGQQDPNYTGIYSNLVNPPSSGGGGDSTVDATGDVVADPCPPGYKMVDGTCQPDTGGFQMGTDASYPTSFTPSYQPVQVSQINPFVLQPYPNGGPGFAFGGSVSEDDEEEAELSEAITGSYTTTGGGRATGFSYDDGMGGGDDNNTQSVMATPIQTQSVIATPLMTPPAGGENLVPVNNLQSERNARIQQRIDALRANQQQQQATTTQPGLAKTLMDGALDIFGPTVTKTADATITGAQSMPQMNPNIQGQVGDITKQGQIQAPAGLGDIVPSADQAVSGISQGQFTNVMPESQPSMFSSPEAFREAVGLPDDVAGAIGDIFSGLGQTIVGKPDTFQNLGTLGQSDRVYGSSNYQGTGGSFNPFR